MAKSEEKTNNKADTEKTFGIEEMATFCKQKGFVFPSSEIYGGMAGFWDYGPQGAELKRNLMSEWWKYHVQSRQDIVGIDGSIISNPKVWVASGHVGGFGDVMVEDVKTKKRYRADELLEEALDIQCDGLSPEDLQKLITENKLKSPDGNDLGNAKTFNLLFKTSIGAVEGEKAVAYLRGETAQIIFAEFKNVFDTSRQKLPFGIAQMGKAFRNEINPRNFLFRSREFEQMEIEYFIHPDKKNDCPFFEEIKDYKLSVYSAEMQEKNSEPANMSAAEAVEKGIIKSQWHAYWLSTELKWFEKLGADMSNFRIRQHGKDELAFYSSDCWDLEYKFPFGWKELQGIADRSDYDLSQHSKHSGKDHKIFDEETKQKVMPNVVAEPSLGVDRSFLVFMFDAYEDDKKRGNKVLHLNPKLAPIKVAVLPLVNKINDKAQEIYKMLKDDIVCFYDRSGSIGRRYARMDEMGTPFCVTIDFDTIENGDVTIRERDSTEQVRVKIEELKTVLKGLLDGDKNFADLK